MSGVASSALGGALFASYDPGSVLRRDVFRAGRAAAALRSSVREALSAAGDPIRRTPQAGRHFVSAPGHHLHRLQRWHGDGAAVPFRSDSPHPAALPVEPHRARPVATGGRAKPVSARHLRRAAHPEGPQGPALAGLLLPSFPPRNDRAGGVARHLHAHLWHRPHPRLSQRRVPGAGGQRPHAQWRFLRTGKPPGDDAHLPRRCSAPTRSCRSTTTRPNWAASCAAFRHAEWTTRPWSC